MHCETDAYLPDDAYDTIARAGDWLSLRARARACLAPLGATDFMLKLEHGRPLGASTHLTGTLDDTVLQLFGDRDCSDADPVNRHLRSPAIPHEWQPAQLSQLAAPPVYQLLSKAGIKHGLSLSMRGTNSASRIDFYGKADARLAASPALRATFVLLGAHLHCRADDLLSQQGRAPAPQLSKRELECIKWSAAGKTCAEIGLILGIGRRTAYFHLHNVAAKLEVYSTRHAIGRAAELGLLD